MCNHHDLIVIGGGPAGTAAAITAARRGASVVLIERETFPRYRPGETLHPGLEPLLVRLGVWDEIEKLGFVRHPGTEVKWGVASAFVPFGADQRGTWLGLQAMRADFDVALLNRARAVGVSVLQPCSVTKVLTDANRVCGLETDGGEIQARFVLDATGGRQWLAHELGLEMLAASAPLLARFGYRHGDYAPARETPCITADETGWTWIARVQEETYQWTRLDFSDCERPPTWCPPELDELKEQGHTRGANVTWRICEQLCGLGFFLTGDAAFVLDPASSHGVLKAIMSGILAGESVGRILQSPENEATILAGYQQWLEAWFWNDVSSLSERYAELPSPPDWIRNRCSASFQSKQSEFVS